MRGDGPMSVCFLGEFRKLIEACRLRRQIGILEPGRTPYALSNPTGWVWGHANCIRKATEVSGRHEHVWIGTSRAMRSARRPEADRASTMFRVLGAALIFLAYAERKAIVRSRCCLPPTFKNAPSWRMFLTPPSLISTGASPCSEARIGAMPSLSIIPEHGVRRRCSNSFGTQVVNKGHSLPCRSPFPRSRISMLSPQTSVPTFNEEFANFRQIKLQDVKTVVNFCTLSHLNTTRENFTRALQTVDATRQIPLPETLQSGASRGKQGSRRLCNSFPAAVCLTIITTVSTTFHHARRFTLQVPIPAILPIPFP